MTEETGYQVTWVDLHDWDDVDDNTAENIAVLVNKWRIHEEDQKEKRRKLYEELKKEFELGP